MKFRRPRFVAFPAFCIALVSIAVLPSGCEWESSGSDNTWSDSMSWANFSGVYRSGSSAAALVSNFSLTSGGTASTDSSTTSEVNEYPFADVAGPIQAGPFTVISEAIDYSNRGTAGWSLKPGSIDITLTGTTTGPIGSFSDNGTGGVSGNYSQVPGGSVFAASGSIDYDTGAWNLSLSATDPFIEPAQISYSYVVEEDVNITGGGGGDDDEDPPSSSGWVYTLQVEQTGNQLQFTDNRGFVWTGTLSGMTTPSGDTTGSTSGAVVGTFSATGSSNSGYTITGTFSGTYTVSTTDDSTTGQLTSRVIQGIWMEPTGNGDLYGETTDGATTTVN